MEQSYGNERTGAPTHPAHRKSPEEKRHCAGFGVVLILVGILWLAARAGWVAGGLICPLAMILIGLWICLPSIRRHTWR